jgi:hypothetical protein
MSIKDRWVGPSEQVLNILIACQKYGPGKRSSQLSIEDYLFHTASVAVIGEKLGTDLWIGQSSCCGLGWEPFFSGAVDLFKSIDDYAKGCYTLTTWDMYGRGSYADRAWDVCGMLARFPLQGVHWFESLWLSDMSNLIHRVLQQKCKRRCGSDTLNDTRATPYPKMSPSEAVNTYGVAQYRVHLSCVWTSHW